MPAIISRREVIKASVKKKFQNCLLFSGLWLFSLSDNQLSNFTKTIRLRLREYLIFTFFGE